MKKVWAAVACGFGGGGAALELTIQGQRVRERVVSIIDGELEVTVLEVTKPAALIEEWYEAAEGAMPDPFGALVWPGALVASRALADRRRRVENATVLTLGIGTGVEALAAASLGARTVIAADLNPLALALVEAAADRAGLLGNAFRVLHFDVLDEKQPLPDCDVLVCADMMYDANLAAGLGMRCAQAARHNKAVCVVTDSQKYGHADVFADAFHDAHDADAAASSSLPPWTNVVLHGFTGPNHLKEGDSTYDARTRLLVLDPLLGD